MRIEEDVRTYQASEWAAKRWDWFNRGKVIEPLSFCQFWRTVLIWATLRQLLIAFLFIPVRIGGRAALAGVVSSGERFNRFGEHHDTLIRRIGIGFLALYLSGCATIIIMSIIGVNLLWALLVMGLGFAIGLAFYTLLRIGALGLMWQAAVAAKHGICPPVKIEREEAIEATPVP